MWGLIFVHFRLSNLTYIHIQPKIDSRHGLKAKEIFAEKYRKHYAGKEKLYARHRGFMIPKASPLEASYDLLSYKVNISCMSIDFRETSNGQYFHGWKWESARKWMLIQKIYQTFAVYLTSQHGGPQQM